MRTHALRLAALVVVSWGLQVQSAGGQSLYADSAGVYATVDDVDVNVGNDPAGLQGRIGYRFGNGFDLGAAYSYDGTFGTQEGPAGDGGYAFQGFRFGPTVGYTQPLGLAGLHLNTRATAMVGLGNVNSEHPGASGGAIRTTNFGQEASASVGLHRLLRFGGLRAAPGVSLSGFAGRNLSRSEQNGEDLRAVTTRWATSAELLLPVTFRLKGATSLTLEPYWSWTPRSQLHVFGETYRYPGSTDFGIRVGINF